MQFQGVSTILTSLVVLVLLGASGVQACGGIISPSALKHGLL